VNLTDSVFGANFGGTTDLQPVRQAARQASLVELCLEHCTAADKFAGAGLSARSYAAGQCYGRLAYPESQNSVCDFLLAAAFSVSFYERHSAGSWLYRQSRSPLLRLYNINEVNVLENGFGSEFKLARVIWLPTLRMDADRLPLLLAQRPPPKCGSLEQSVAAVSCVLQRTSSVQAGTLPTTHRQIRSHTFTSRLTPRI